ncbi:MAG: thioredoxin domain-containing protein [Candidatus Hydrogenedentes bacterium]|nr:thioredoxin domain-containing protein [Candidatus Hydrogenedentota bacterium]
MTDRGAAHPKHTNRLIDATSPYLLQHAHNPVAWYPWGEEALKKAKNENKPIFLSIGYAACHWCHVMAHESFENEALAAFLNEHFISIKVDREERPDIDSLYMTATQIMTGGGGWPMSVFLTADLKPFYAGTYFPPHDMMGRPGFKSVLESIADAWNTRQGEVLESAEKLTRYLRQNVGIRTGTPTTPTPSLIAEAVGELLEDLDPKHGGFGSAPKFPPHAGLELLFRHWHASRNTNACDAALFTLRKMAWGGIYDHIGGGFHRYSVDERWLVPHFEKMLYDNAQLAPLYLNAYQLTHDPFYRRIAEEIFAYILRDMTSSEGGFYCSEDADSEGQEGKFYLWTHGEIIELLGEEDAALFNAYYNIRPEGNFSSHEDYYAGQNIPHVTEDGEDFAGKHKLSAKELERNLMVMRKALLEVRSKRVRPALDDKILTSWNALTISAFAQGHQVLGKQKLRHAAENAGKFILTHMKDGDGLLRSYHNGESHYEGYLDDYAFLMVALLDLYEATFDMQWVDAAREIAEALLVKFWDREEGGFFFTSPKHKHLIAQDKPVFDGAEPSGNAMAALGLLRLAKFSGVTEYYEKAERVLRINHANLESAPRAQQKMLCAADFYLNAPKEIVIAGQTGARDVHALLAALHRHYIPNKVITFIDPYSADAQNLQDKVPLLNAKTLVNGKAAAYVCKDFTCLQPVTSPEALVELLGVVEDK